VKNLKFLFFSFKKLLECCGNLNDACVLASKFAIEKAELPKLIVKSDDGGEIELDISDNPSDVLKLDSSNVPFAVSISKIGNSYVVDSDLKEESVTKVRLTFGLDSNGMIRYSSKDGFGSLDPDTLYSMIDVIIITSFSKLKLFSNLFLNFRLPRTLPRRSIHFIIKI
jgi:exosome complex RNA-binding protein Rrp42 (RNase PH superfamily)